MPTFSTMPTPSWPRIVPGFISEIVPRTKWRSVPQMALAVSRTIASVSSWMRGSGTSFSSMSPIPFQTTAFMIASLIGGGCKCRSGEREAPG